MEGDADRAGDGLRRTNGCADGDRAHQQRSECRDEGPRDLRLTGHFKTPFFARSSNRRVDAQYNSSAVPIPQNCEKSLSDDDCAASWEVSPTNTWRNPPTSAHSDCGNQLGPLALDWLK